MKIVTRARDPRREFRCVLRFAAETRARLVIGCLPVVAARNGNRTRHLASPFFASPFFASREDRWRERRSDAVSIVAERNGSVIKESPGFKNVRKECTGEINALVLRYLISG